MRIDKYFDCVYLLNLHKRPQRLDLSTRRMKFCDIEFVRFGATDGSVMNKLWESFSKENLYFKNPSYLGCAISHLSIYRDALERGYKKILILEDDNRIHKDANKEFERILPQIPESFELLYLGFIPLTDDCSMWNYNVFSDKFISQNVFAAKNLWGLYSYGISDKLMTELLEIYSNEFPMELDRYFVTHIQPRGLSYGITPQLFAADDGESDNSGINETGMLERSIDARFANIKQYI
jgi:GR25 family glycosyltransferase involved in LPS biosynthesis